MKNAAAVLTLLAAGFGLAVIGAPDSLEQRAPHIAPYVQPAAPKPAEPAQVTVPVPVAAIAIFQCGELAAIWLIFPDHVTRYDGSHSPPDVYVLRKQIEAATSRDAFSLGCRYLETQT